MSKPADAVTVVIPVHNTPDRLEAALPAWGAVLEKLGRSYEILVVDDGSTGATAETAAKLKGRVRNLRTLRHESRQGFGACLRTALAETRTPLFFYTAVDYPYTPSDIRPMLERIELRDEILHKQPDLISGCRTGQFAPAVVIWTAYAWKVFWRVFAGLPIAEAAPWHGWPQLLYRWRVGWVYAVPMVDVNSCFKLFRTSFLRRFPIQSDGDFVHTELVAKATFLTSIMDEVPLTPKPDPFPPLGSLGADRGRVFRNPDFSYSPPPPAATSPPAAAGSPPAEPLPPTVFSKSEPTEKGPPAEPATPAASTSQPAPAPPPSSPPEGQPS
jgi:glycosyltransferase involved in cell wall biosynthesis